MDKGNGGSEEVGVGKWRGMARGEVREVAEGGEYTTKLRKALAQEKNASSPTYYK
jgi:hypothetical protein